MYDTVTQGPLLGDEFFSEMKRNAIFVNVAREGVVDEEALLSAIETRECVAVCCSVLQCVAVCCSVLQCVAVC